MWLSFSTLLKRVITYHFVKMFEKTGLNSLHGICIAFKCHSLNDINVFLVFLSTDIQSIIWNSNKKSNNYD